MSLKIQIHPALGRNRLVALSGRLDTHSYGEFDRELAPVLISDVHSLVLDLRDLDYISSAGIRSIFKARKALATRGGKVLLVNPQPQIQKVIDIVKAVPLSEIFTSMAEADAYLDMMQRRVIEDQDG